MMADTYVSTMYQNSRTQFETKFRHESKFCYWNIAKELDGILLYTANLGSFLSLAANFLDRHAKDKWSLLNFFFFFGSGNAEMKK